MSFSECITYLITLYKDRFLSNCALLSINGGKLLRLEGVEMRCRTRYGFKESRYKQRRVCLDKLSRQTIDQR